MIRARKGAANDSSLHRRYYLRMSGIISIRKYLQGSNARFGEETLRRGLCLLLEGIALHAVEADRVDYDAFQTEMGNLSGRLAGETPTPDILLVVGLGLKALENYNRRAASFLRFQASELQSMVSMLTQTVSLIANGQERSVQRLQEIEKQIEKASVAEDIRTLKVRLADCLVSLRENVAVQREESTNLVDGLMKGIQAVKEHPIVKPPADPTTSLPTRADAERALAAAIQTGGNFFVGVFALERIQSVNARFGYSVGNRMLATFKKCLDEAFPQGDALFRWSGPAFVLLLERDAPIEFVRAELGRICDRKIELEVTIGTRSALLPVSASFTIMPMLPSVKLLAHKIDAFIASGVEEAPA
jgi:GGDEF domain-containing protein